MGCMRLSVLLCTGLLLSASVLAADEPDKDEKKWRYKIFTAEHQSIEKGGSKEVKSIFKIDLETGKVWRYRQGIDQEGKKYEEFFEIPEQ